MKNLQEFTKLYMAQWNEIDEERRRAIISEIWATEADDYLPTQPKPYHGLDEINGRVSSTNKKWVQEGGHSFKATGTPTVNHDSLRITWDMLDAEGTVKASGFDFLILNEDDKIIRAYQFVGK
ncbi:MAG: hypothetical protein ACQR33_01690 [Candidatus Saccharibacteria bacterium]